MKLGVRNLAVAVTLVTVLSFRSLNSEVLIDVIGLVVGDNVGNGRAVISAAYDVAFEKARALYPRVFDNLDFHLHSVAGEFSCKDAAGLTVPTVGEMIAKANISEEIERTDGVLRVLLSPGCSLEVIALADLAREFDTFVLASTATDQILTDRSRFPTVIALGPSGYGTLAKYMISLLDEYNWKKLSVICIIHTRGINYTVGLDVMCKAFREGLSSRLDINPLFMGSEKFEQEQLKSFLLSARKFSGVVVIISISPITTEILKLAVEHGMASGKYAFIIPRVFNEPESATDLIPAGDQFDKYRMVIPYTLKVYPQLVDREKIRHDWEKIQNNSIVEHGIVPSDALEANVVHLSAYESVLILAQVLNETHDSLRNMTATAFTNQFLGRSFALEGETVDISHSGLRMVDGIMAAYDPVSQLFRPVIRFDQQSPEDRIIKHFLSPKPIWSNLPFPIDDSPDCRFSGQGCISPGVGNLWLLLLLIPICAAFGQIIAQQFRNARIKQNSWWLSDISRTSLTEAPPTVFLINGIQVSPAFSAHHKQIRMYHESYYHGKKVEFIQLPFSLTFDEIHRNGTAVSILITMIRLDHVNLAKFIGLGNVCGARDLVWLFEYPHKGSLRQVIDNDDMVFNWDLRFSLIWDLMEGLKYLHSTPLRFHGSLVSFVNLILDEHFTLKISRPGAVHFCSTFCDKDQELPLPTVCCLWVAPELIAGLHLNAKLVREHGGPACDIYSLGIVLYEMGTRRTPYGADISDINDISDKISRITAGTAEPGSCEPTPEIPTIITDIVKQCWARNPEERPTLHAIQRVLRAAHPKNNSNVAENLLRRLENYNKELESIVQSRTEALQVEMQRTDELLRNLLPIEAAKKLRNHEQVADFFPSVTVMFSDIPAFNNMVALCTPFAVVEFLHHLYSVLDEEVAKHNVYKLASGVPEKIANHASQIAEVALKFLAAASAIPSPCTPGEFVRLRMGINSGPVMAAIIGVKLPHYCLVGDTVNTASRMESHGLESRIHLSLSAKNLIDEDIYQTKPRGIVNIKGKGELFTYWLLGKYEAAHREDIQAPGSTKKLLTES